MGVFRAETTELQELSSRKPGVGPDLPAVMPSSSFPRPIMEQQPGSQLLLCLGGLGRAGVGSSACW